MREAFKIAGAKPEGETCDAFLSAIYRKFPKLRRETAYFPGQGVSAFTVIIGDWVFKTARTEDSLAGKYSDSYIKFLRESIEREYKILCHLKGRGLPVPEPGVEGQDPPFFSMARKTGIKLDQDILDDMTEEERRTIAQDLAGFMARLSNAFTAEDARKIGFEDDAMTAREMKPEDFKALLDDPAVAKRLGNKLDFCRQIHTEFAKKYEEKYRNMPMVVSHGDLKPDNILYNPATKRIDGFIGCMVDLGSCRYLRPEMDYINMAPFYKDDFIAMVCDAYSKQTGSKLSLRDVKVWECAFWVSLVNCKDEKQRQGVWNRLTKAIESLDEMQGAGSSLPSGKIKAPARSPPASG